MTYEVQNHLKPKKLHGISTEQVDQHWSLYEGYVKNVNGLFEQLGNFDASSREAMELRRRAGFEFNGMVLHELYFDNLVAGSTMSRNGKLAKTLSGNWGSLEAWRNDLTQTALMRGIGWAILYHDAQADRLFNWWITDHEINHPANCNPILVLDVWEHAYMVDHGSGGRADYVEAFLRNVNWDRVQERFERSCDGRAVARF